MSNRRERGKPTGRHHNAGNLGRNYSNSGANQEGPSSQTNHGSARGGGTGRGSTRGQGASRGGASFNHRTDDASQRSREGRQNGRIPRGGPNNSSQGTSGGHHGNHRGSRGGAHQVHEPDSLSVRSQGAHRESRGAQRGRDSQGSSRGGSVNFVTEEELQAISQLGPEEVLAFASQNEKRFLNIFKIKTFYKRPIFLKRLIKIVYSLVHSSDKKFVATKLAHILSGDGDYAAFLVEVEQLIKKMPFEHKDHICQSNVVTIGHLIDIGHEAFLAIPSMVVVRYPILSLKQTIEDLKSSNTARMDLVANNFEKLFTIYEDTKSRKMAEMVQNMKKVKITPECEPPEDFTELPILPRVEELLVHSNKVYLRPNIVSGGYTSWAHYFDVQFRLLREDFVRPLRQGIEAYCDTGSTRNISDIRVYNSARILNPVCLFSGIGFVIKFDVSMLQKVNWEHSRRLIFGSMLCLSQDGFKDSIMFATVVKRDPKLLEEGIITVKFEDNSTPFAASRETTFKMVESTAYFEAYRYVLERLQNLSFVPDQMPMKSYIVDCVNYEEILKVPGFMNLRTSRPVFDLHKILSTRYPFDVIDLTKWPLARNTGLDDSQLEALKMALTREVAVIQGPPGTGKTYIGLKIAETYLRNRLAWDPSKTTPILVVCYTNHALDQFLEGIMNISGLSTNIIRIGGRSKNPVLSDCLLREKIQAARTERSIPGDIFHRFQDAREEMNFQQLIIEQSIKNCDAEMKNKIISFDDLKEHISVLHSSQILYGRPTEAHKEIEVWLGLWFPEEYGSQETQDQYFVQDEQPMLFDDQAPDLGNQVNSPSQNNETLAEEDDSYMDEFIDVDNEAYVLENDRMIDGVEIELPAIKLPQPSVPKKKKKKKKKSQDGFSVVQLLDNKRYRLIKNGFDNKAMSASTAKGVLDVWSLNVKQRWSLYLYWVNQYVTQCKSQIGKASRNYDLACANYSRAQKLIDCYVAQKADVIGMTTTGAAKYHHLLDDLHPKIAIFEEAAEVLEAHLVTSIASSIQQVILIGDHKQLRPKPTCYDLEKKYNLGISLFERLVDPKGDGSELEKDGFPFVTLEVQHRMRPEISKLVHPSIYKRLIDDESVKHYGHVKGVSKDLFFICHTSPEEDRVGDSKSHVNKFEANYAVQLCHYLLKQGYSPHEVTILTMYRGQLLELKKRMKRDDFQGVRVAAVDDFQGEENEIIILSLVRSNSDSNIGFLSIENRVCVSLSRAKQGLYIIGNGHILKNSEKTKWPEIIKYLESENCFGRNLSLYCQNHPADIKVIVNPDDFNSRPEGGCQKVCNERLSCGHSCPRLCHIRDRDHTSARCTKKCNKQLSCGHYCTRECYQCFKSKKCNPCQHLVEKLLPCGHSTKEICSKRIDQIRCPVQCPELLACGHQCVNNCSEPCTTRCRYLVSKTLPCGHSNEVECFKDPEEISCSIRCGKALECGDICNGTCGKCLQGRLHVQCKKKCGRVLVCGHSCDFPCASVCPPCNQPCNNYCIHSQCPKKCYEQCKPCIEPCEWNCPHFQCHKPCGQLCDRPPCDKPCNINLECGHQCIGLCGENCPNKCRICNRDEVCNIFFGREDEEDARYIQLQDCGHLFEVRDLDEWMNLRSSEEEEVKFKTCPRCTTQIRKSVRYGNQIKRVLHDIDAIKEKQLADIPLRDNHAKALDQIKSLKSKDFISKELAAIAEEICDSQRQLNSFRATTVNLQLSILPVLLHLKNILDDCSSNPQVGNYNCYMAMLDVSRLKQFLMQQFLSAQQRSDIVYELRRVTCLVKLLDVYGKLTVAVKTVSPADLDGVAVQIKALCVSTSKVSEDEEKRCMGFIKDLSEQYHINGLSEQERIQIVAAMDLRKGHWYKCRNGHYYCIGDCGGAVVTARCPECNAVIGGSNHRLADGNAHAGEMDNSANAAWSDGANLLNYAEFANRF